MWIGIVLIIIGFLSLAWQATKRISDKTELEKFPKWKEVMKLHRNYSLITIFSGMIVLIIAISV